MNRWKAKRDKKLNDLKRESQESMGLRFKPEINPISKQILEVKSDKIQTRLNQSKSGMIVNSNNTSH